MIYHFVLGEAAAEPVKEAILTEPTMAGEVVVLTDRLDIGPLKKEGEQTFSELRNGYWQSIAASDKTTIHVADMERLLAISAEMFKNEEISAWLWMAPAAADVCAYYWMLPYLSKHTNRFFLLNIAGLPFLDENGKVYYPKSINQLLPKEVIKARKLARAITPSELEVDIDEWQSLVEENTGIRILDGGKKLSGREETYHDNQLMSFCSHQFQKASKIVRQTISKFQVPVPDTFLGYRLRKLSEEGRIMMQGDPAKPLNEIDVRLPGEIVSEASVSTETTTE
jgi:hypothetical protein